MAGSPRRIVTGYDGSEGSLRALDAAAELVGYGSTLVVVSTSTRGPSASPPARRPGQAAAAAPSGARPLRRVRRRPGRRGRRGGRIPRRGSRRPRPRKSTRRPRLRRSGRPRRPARPLGRQVYGKPAGAPRGARMPGGATTAIVDSRCTRERSTTPRPSSASSGRRSARTSGSPWSCSRPRSSPPTRLPPSRCRSSSVRSGSRCSASERRSAASSSSSSCGATVTRTRSARCGSAPSGRPRWPGAGARRRGSALSSRARPTNVSSRSSRSFDALVAELEDASLALDPAAAVVCAQLLTDVVESPLLRPEKPVEELRAAREASPRRLRLRRLTPGSRGSAEKPHAVSVRRLMSSNVAARTVEASHPRQSATKMSWRTAEPPDSSRHRPAKEVSDEGSRLPRPRFTILGRGPGSFRSRPPRTS